jgi:hypothetical protein
MTERKSYDSVDDLERLVKDEHTDMSVNDDFARPVQQRQARYRHVWSQLGWAMLLAGVFVVGYLGGNKSASDASMKGPWVAGPLGAPYSNCKSTQEKIQAGKHVSDPRPL